MMSRRNLLFAAAGLGGIAAVAKSLLGREQARAAAQTYEISRTPAEWKQILTSEQFRVLREHGTERPYSSPLNDEHRHRVFSCAGCDLPLFRSETKFDSGTGWPSFFAPIENAVVTSTTCSMTALRLPENAIA